MKNAAFFGALLIVLLLSTCKEDDGGPGLTTDFGLLSSIALFIDGEITNSTTGISYDNEQRMSSIDLRPDPNLRYFYEVGYVDDEIKTLTITEDRFGMIQVIPYNVIYEGNEIILEGVTDNERAFVFSLTNGYLDTYTWFNGSSPDQKYEVIFTRDANDNIDTISYYVTDNSVTDFLAWENTFSDFDEVATLHAGFNPVYDNFNSSLNGVLLPLLNIKVSNQMPLQSSYLDGNGNTREQNVTATTVLDADGKLRELPYFYALSPNTPYRLEFEYN